MKIETTDGRCPKCSGDEPGLPLVWRWVRDASSPRVTKGEARCPICKSVLVRCSAGNFNRVTIRETPTASVGRKEP